MMDFNNKGFTGLDKEKIHYYLPPRKQIMDQLVDLFTGIKQYYDFSDIQLFEIFPFLAVNTENLEFGNESTRYYKKTLKDILNQYFKDFSKDDSGDGRYEYLSNKLDRLRKPQSNGPNEKFNPLDSGFYYFAGIKLYPPLGFDPWPDGNDEKSKQKLKKACYLYEFCVEKNIPITTHCSNGGFMVAGKEDARKFTNPQRWKNVLEAYPKLKVNFAHDGIHDGDKVETEWNRTILGYVIKYDNVFFDIADNVYERDYFKRFFNFILKQNFTSVQLEKISRRMLFGTDFMMLLLGSKSYYDYLVSFSETNAFNDAFVDKYAICNKNSFEFIFGE
ncbi:MAG: amidohydrolase family protein [Chlorobi bacterium]|nr:amidohydrolase family protein [Chlorobiota bacterium]